LGGCLIRRHRDKRHANRRDKDNAENQTCHDSHASLLRPELFLAGHLVLQRKRADRGTASPVIAALCGQNANRQSEHESGGGDDYAFGHHGSPLSFYVHVACITVYSTAACDGGHKLGEYAVEHAEHVSIVIAKNYSRRATLRDWCLGVDPRSNARRRPRSQRR
jgi:hypothetical protein